ncbi:MAG: ABC transporter ATP-binding protein, partial [Candidatus Limnocylindrales bacterium]
LLSVASLRVSTRAGDILRGVDLRVAAGEVTGLVGESGCGKTTLGLALLGLLGRARAITDGEILLDGEVVGAPGVDDTAALRGSRLSFVPQDPFRAFDPLRRVGPQVRRPLELHRGLDRGAADQRVTELLERLGVPEPAAIMGSYPHELSGGMLQRAAIATALSCEPDLVIADEPTTALDALVQIQVAAAFMRLVRELGTAVLVITHDLRLLERMADRIAVMYAGRIVEFGLAERLLREPRHRYPAALLESSVRAAMPGQRLETVEGQPPSLPGTFEPCSFAPRCAFADARCRTEVPTYEWPADEGVACHHPAGGPA